MFDLLDFVGGAIAFLLAFAAAGAFALGFAALYRLVTPHDEGKLIREGKSLEEVVAAKPSASLDPVWGKGFFKADQVVGMVYRDLSRTMK